MTTPIADAAYWRGKFEEQRDQCLLALQELADVKDRLRAAETRAPVQPGIGAATIAATVEEIASKELSLLGDRNAWRTAAKKLAAIVDERLSPPTAALASDDGPEDQARCTSCDHQARFHSEGGCWFTVEAGTPGRNAVCACSAVLVGAISWREMADTVKQQFLDIEAKRSALTKRETLACTDELVQLSLDLTSRGILPEVSLDESPATVALAAIDRLQREHDALRDGLEEAIAGWKGDWLSTTALVEKLRALLDGDPSQRVDPQNVRLPSQGRSAGTYKLVPTEEPGT